MEKNNQLIKRTIKLNYFILQHDLNIFSKPFRYTNETFNGIKKITEQEEIDLCCKIPSKEIINLFTIIYIILEESYLEIPTANLIINLFQII